MSQHNNSDKTTGNAKPNEDEIVGSISLSDKPINWIYKKIIGTDLPDITITKSQTRKLKDTVHDIARGGGAIVPEKSLSELEEEINQKYPEATAKNKAREKRYEVYKTKFMKDVPKDGVVAPAMEYGMKIAAKIGFFFQDEEPAPQKIQDHRPPTPKGAKR